MRVWRNGVMLMKGKNRNIRLKKLERIMFKKPFYFQLHTAKKWNPNTGTTIRGFVCRQETSFTVCMDILKYVLAQATHWCARFLVRIWWRYLRVRFSDDDNNNNNNRDDNYNRLCSFLGHIKHTSSNLHGT
jgi:hypothetical protein